MKNKKDFAVAVSVSRKPKKYAKGGQIPSAKEESRPGTQEERNDKKDIRQNSSDKPAKHDGVLDRSTEAQARKPSHTPLKRPSMVPSDAFSVKLRDHESDLEEYAKVNEGTQHQPPRDDDESDPKKRGRSPHPMKMMATGGKVEEDADHQDDIHNQKVDHEYGDGDEQDDQGSPEGLESDDDMKSPARSKFMAGKMMADGGEVDDEEEMEHDASIAGAIMRKRKYAEGGEVDLDMNAEEEPNHEDDDSYEALQKENYSEEAGLDEAKNPKDSSEHGHEISDEDAHDMVSKIRKLMSKRSPITK